MQISSVSLAAAGGKTSAAKSSKDGFGDLLKGIEQNGSLSVMQLLAGGFVFPQQMTQGEVMQNGAQQGGNLQSQQASAGLPGTGTVGLTGMQEVFIPGQQAAAQDASNSGAQTQSGFGVLNLQAGVTQNTAMNFAVLDLQQTPANAAAQPTTVQNTVTQENPLQSAQANSLNGVFTAMPQQASNAQTEITELPMNFSARIIPQNTAMQDKVQQSNQTQEATKTDSVLPDMSIQGETVQTSKVQDTGNILTTGQNFKITYNNAVSSRNSTAVGSIALDKTAADAGAQTGETVKADSAIQKDTAQFGQMIGVSQSGTVKADPVKAETAQTDPAFKTAAAASHSSKKASDGAQNDSSFQSNENQSGSDGVSNYSTIAAAQSSAASKTEFSTQADKANVSEQVANAVKQAVDSGRHEIRLHLSPEDLGGISIKIVSQDGALSMQITADNAKTGQLISSGMHELSQSMQSQGLSMGKTEVIYSQGDSFGASTGSQQQPDRQNHNTKSSVLSFTQNTAAEPEQNQETVKSGRMSILA